MKNQNDKAEGAARGHLGIVLIVEDEFLIAMDLAAMLTEAGYDVLGPAGRAADALNLLKDRAPDAAVLDVNLGDHRVTAVARELTSRCIPYVLASAYRDLDVQNEPFLANAVNLGKPTLPGLLLSEVRRMIRAARK
jgi:DNA-binding response OmpR family regulator